MAGKAADLAEHQLGQGGAIHAAALLLEDLQDDRVRQCLDRKILLESLVPAKGLVDAADILPDALFVVDVERRGHIFDDLLCHRLGQKRFLFHNNIPLVLRSPACSGLRSIPCGPVPQFKLLQFQVLPGGGTGGDHSRQLAHHALIVVGGSGFQRL